jgi:hypothetical protein
MLMLREPSRSDEDRDQPVARPVAAAGQREDLTWQQAHETAYRFVARYYDHERTGAIRQLLEAVAWAGEHPKSNKKGWVAWQTCVRETLDGDPLPDLPPPWA